MIDLEQVIRQYVPLPARPSAKGWLGVNCKVCNDHGRKGTRGGFHFRDGLGYNCFNCGHAASYTNGQFNAPSEELHTVLQAFGIPEDIWNQLMMESLKNRNSGQLEFNKKLVKQNTFEAKTIQIPKYLVPLSELDPDAPIRQLAELHLKEDRMIDPSSYPFMIGVKDAEDPYSVKWARRLIIPIFDRGGRPIFYQGRDLTGKANSKYISCSAERDNVLYGMDQVYAHSNAPLFVVEGFFDAFHLNGAATLGRQLTEGMAYHLNKSVRDKIIIPDRTGNGEDLALAGLKRGWKVSTPDFGGCKDVTEAVVKYGKLYTMKTILDNIHSGFGAELNVRMYCK